MKSERKEIARSKPEKNIFAMNFEVVFERLGNF